MSYFNKTSLLVPSQLPEYIRDDPSYANFVTFLQAYYEWVEQEGGFVYESKNLKNYYDIDETLDKFIDYYVNEFMPLFPQETLSDKRKLIKKIREVYQTKGTPNSYKFLFRSLYNSESELYNSKDFVLVSSDGKWVVTKYITINSTDPTWRQSIGYRLFGVTSKGYATIENIIINENNIQVIVTGIERNFSSGEYVKVVDYNYQPVEFSNGQLIAQSYGVITSVTPDSRSRGENYDIGDPVVFYGGLNPELSNPVGASAYVSEITYASVTGIESIYAGQGYRPGGYTDIIISSTSGAGNGAVGIVTDDNFITSSPYYVDYVPTDILDTKWDIQLNSGNYQFANLVNANANTTLAVAFTHPSLNTFGIRSATIISGGTGYDATAYANAIGYFATESGDHSVVDQPIEKLPDLGILAPILIEDGGLDYSVGDTIHITGGRGFGAHANITSVAANGLIQLIDYVRNPIVGDLYPLGGMGYTKEDLPVVTITSANGIGAILTIPGIVGGDAVFGLNETTYGQVQKITVTNPGRDYVSAPSVSLRVTDLLVYNVDINNLPLQGDKIYQTDIVTSTFLANVANLSLVEANTTTTLSKYNLRIYNYDGTFFPNTSIYVSRDGSDIGANLLIANVSTGVYTNGIKQYGNGSAKATVNFTNGVISTDGIYINYDGQPSAYSVLQDDDYNNYTYILQVQKELAKYKDTAIQFLHPAGLKYRSVDIIRSSNNFTQSANIDIITIQSLGYLLDVSNYIATIPNNANTIFFTNLGGANVAEVVNVNSWITYDTRFNHPFYSKIKGVTSNTITLQDNFISTVPNVAIANVSSNSTVININSLTNAWNVATGNIVSNISNFVNNYDFVSFDNGTTYKMVVSVNGDNNTITVNSSYTSAQTGYLMFSKNVQTSDIYVSGYVSEMETIDILTESGIPLTTEDGRILLVG